jgi:N-alpha-acetyltransferase 35, NatC auxiliary subunit
MEWHAGNTFSQTVYTFLYVHNIADMNPEFISQFWTVKDPARPMELVSVVLRAAVLGLLKSCALAWMELAKSRVYDVSVTSRPNHSFAHSCL